MTQVAAGLRQIYLDADYAVFADPPFVLRIGEPSKALLQVYARLDCERCAYLTACNPRSRRLRPAANARRMRALRAALLLRGWRPIDGEGRDPQGGWPAEPSLLVPGMDIAAALALARRFGQNAIVAAGPRGIPELTWVPRPGSAADRCAGPASLLS
ncbi:DUF3293 domain-containing protein [Castellaniella sp. S9]|uniref:DUF3293 domain-containing protein n=1 Tax=Castellaniella sp. S9 TaxID=2993652 RepID=UPI0022B4F1B3|nr:DUF3293 domain-containing protein [Castellaniella sp. S9]